MTTRTRKEPTPEQKEAKRVRDREYHRRIRANLTPEQKALKKRVLTPKQKETKNKKLREQRTNRTPEERVADSGKSKTSYRDIPQEKKDDINAKRRLKRANRTPEQKAADSLKERTAYQNLSPEAKRELIAKSTEHKKNISPEARARYNESARIRVANETPEQKARKNIRHKNWRHSRPESKKLEVRTRSREYYHKMTPEQKLRKLFKEQERIRNMSPEQYEAHLARKSATKRKSWPKVRARMKAKFRAMSSVEKTAYLENQKAIRLRHLVKLAQKEYDAIKKIEEARDPRAFARKQQNAKNKVDSSWEYVIVKSLDDGLPTMSSPIPGRFRSLPNSKG